MALGPFWIIWVHFRFFLLTCLFGSLWDILGHSGLHHRNGLFGLFWVRIILAHFGWFHSLVNCTLNSHCLVYIQQFSNSPFHLLWLWIVAYGLFYHCVLCNDLIVLIVCIRCLDLVNLLDVVCHKKSTYLITACLYESFWFLYYSFIHLFIYLFIYSLCIFLSSHLIVFT